MRSLALAFWLLSITSAGHAAAPFCNLRDPSHQIFDMFPTATSFRSVVREVNEEVRQTVTKQMPFQLHNNELGEHTLYIPVRENVPLGIVHVRSEPIDWGLAEIVWALDSQFNVQDIRFQRCRSRACNSLLRKGFVEVLQGKSTGELVPLTDNQHLSDELSRLELNSAELSLARTLVQSAIKTIAVTQSAWPDTVADIRSELE